VADESCIVHLVGAEETIAFFKRLFFSARFLRTAIQNFIPKGSLSPRTLFSADQILLNKACERLISVKPLPKHVKKPYSKNK